nr:unnamed protein product [Digitaria exilis]
MATGGKGWAERVRRAVRTIWVMVVMVASLLVASAPTLVAAGDVAVALWLEVRLGCLSGHGLRGHVQQYRFRSSLADIPLVSILRSLVITCLYLMSDTSGLSYGPYLGTTTFCSLASLLILLIKASVYSPGQDVGPELSPSLPDHKLNLKKLWGMPVLFLSSLVFALGHVIVAYRTSCRARRKLLIHRIDPESILACKNAFSGCYKVPRSPTPYGAKLFSRSENEIPLMSLDNGSADIYLNPLGFDPEAGEQGWGLTSRPRRKDWEDKKLPNPYKLESQVDLLISFCSEMGLRSVILVGHDDGGLLALKAAEKLRTYGDNVKVEVKGVVLVGVSLSREVIPAFARILLHTPLRKKHMVRPLLRTEITQAPLFVEGWDEALHEVGRLSFSTVLSSKRAADLLRSMEDLPVLVVAGSEDALVSVKSAQAMASKLVNSRIVTISGCGHLPHEECPKALLSALSPFISRLVPSGDSSRRL